ncbi:alpha/beta hydrolase [Bacillus sp. LL01]|nr:alpha/beta hydrolase [Bacillus sp. LL01]
MKAGNIKQQEAYVAMRDLNILNELDAYNPILCGTLPIGIDIQGSDLDIIMEVQELGHFAEKLQTLYADKENFSIKRTTIRGREVVKANFIFRDFEFELFGQAQPVHKQFAYLHMMIEYELLKRNPGLKEKVINLKNQGYKTEPAFCKLLNICGDPYEGLIRFGVEEGIVQL